MSPFDRLAQVELQLVMQHCDKATLLALARCSRSTLAAASHRFAWRSLSRLALECKSPLELSSRVSASLLRHADLSVRWSMRSDAPEGEAAIATGSEGERQQTARVAAEAAALAALPGLRQLRVDCLPEDLSPLCTALLARLADGGALTSLHLTIGGEEDDQADFAALGQFVARSRSLTALQVHDSNFDAADIRTLANGVQQSQTLATLDLNGSHICNEGAVALAAAAHCRSLTELRLRDCSIADAGVDALAAALGKGDSSIRSLDLSRNEVQAAGAAAVARLLASARCLLQSLNLSNCVLGDAGAQSLAAALRTNRTLTELRLENNCIKAADSAALTAALQTNSHLALRQLDLSYNRVDATGAASLAGFMRGNSALEELELSSCGLDDAAVAALAAGLPAARSLRELLLRHNPFGAAGATALAAGIGACPSLTLLDVRAGERIRDAGLATLAPALAHLRHFDAGRCGLTHASAASLASLLQPGRQLQTLSLNYNDIGTAAVIALSAALQPASSLRTLHLRGCGVGEQAAAALGEALRRGWAGTDLSLIDNGLIGDDGARALAAALERSGLRCSLHTLSLDDCDLTVAGARALIRAAATVPSLRSLFLRRNLAIQAADKPALREACGDKARFELWL